MYDVRSLDSNEFIDNAEILESLEEGRKLASDRTEVERILNKARECRGLTHREAAVLLFVDDEETLKSMYALAREIKEHIYGRRIVMFAPLYLSNYCINSCSYCPYHAKNKHICRKKLTQEEIKREVIALQDMGHKRLALEAGEDPLHNPIEYILESIDTVYHIQHKNGAIRRVNVNIAATTIQNYRKLHDAGIGNTTTGSGNLSTMLSSTLFGYYLKDNQGRATQFKVPTFEPIRKTASGRAKTQLRLPHRSHGQSHAGWNR